MKKRQKVSYWPKTNTAVFRRLSLHAESEKSCKSQGILAKLATSSGRTCNASWQLTMVVSETKKKWRKSCHIMLVTTRGATNSKYRIELLIRYRCSLSLSLWQLVCQHMINYMAQCLTERGQCVDLLKWCAMETAEWKRMWMCCACHLATHLNWQLPMLCEIKCVCVCT